MRQLERDHVDFLCRQEQRGKVTMAVSFIAFVICIVCLCHAKSPEGLTHPVDSDRVSAQ